MDTGVTIKIVALVRFKEITRSTRTTEVAQAISLFIIKKRQTVIQQVVQCVTTSAHSQTPPASLFPYSQCQTAKLNQ